MSWVLDLGGHLGHWAPILTILGLLSALRIVLGLVENLHDLVKAFVLPRIFPVDLGKTFGRWAIVTGCTGGIGRAYVLALAAKGMDIVLVGRSMEKLRALEDELERKYGCRVMIIQADFTDVSVLPVIVQRLREEKVEVGVLVNNVGIQGPGNLPFLELDLTLVKDIITVNITAATYLCHQLLPAMISKGKGAIVNVASFGSYIPGPYLAEYIATKHYLHSLTESLALELEGTGVVIQEIDPSVVNTEMTKNMYNPAFKRISPNAEQFVRSALPTLGWVQRTCGHWSHGLQWWVGKLFRDTWVQRKVFKKGFYHSYKLALQTDSNYNKKK